MVRTTTPAVAALLAAVVFAPASSTFAQGVGTPAARLELRIVPQNGLPPDAAGVVDLPTPIHDDITADGQRRRFEIQYRIIDLITTDAVIPTGLAAATLRIDASGPGLGAARLDRAVLSRFEAELADSTPPVSPDQSGPTLGPTHTGLHRPFRSAIPDPAPNNDHAANGVFADAGRSIVNIMPLSAADPGQDDPAGWYGLYSFDLDAAGVQLGQIVLTATVVADEITGNRFSFWSEGSDTPRLSPAANPATASVTSTIPAPAAVAPMLLAAGLTTARRRHAA